MATQWTMTKDEILDGIKTLSEYYLYQADRKWLPDLDNMKESDELRLRKIFEYQSQFAREKSKFLLCLTDAVTFLDRKDQEEIVAALSEIEDRLKSYLLDVIDQSFLPKRSIEDVSFWLEDEESAA